MVIVNSILKKSNIDTNNSYYIIIQNTFVSYFCKNLYILVLNKILLGSTYSFYIAFLKYFFNITVSITIIARYKPGEQS